MLSTFLRNFVHNFHVNHEPNFYENLTKNLNNFKRWRRPHDSKNIPSKALKNKNIFPIHLLLDNKNQLRL